MSRYAQECFQRIFVFAACGACSTWISRKNEKNGAVREMLLLRRSESSRMSRSAREPVSGSQSPRLPFWRALLICLELLAAAFVGVLVALYFVVRPFEPLPHVAGGPGDGFIVLFYILATRYVGVPAAAICAIAALLGLAVEETRGRRQLFLALFVFHSICGVLGFWMCEKLLPGEATKILEEIAPTIH